MKWRVIAALVMMVMSGSCRTTKESRLRENEREAIEREMRVMTLARIADSVRVRIEVMIDSPRIVVSGEGLGAAIEGRRLRARLSGAAGGESVAESAVTEQADVRREAEVAVTEEKRDERGWWWIFGWVIAGMVVGLVIAVKIVLKNAK